MSSIYEHSRLLPDQVLRAYRRLGAEGRGVLIAVSGGADSVALLFATHAHASALGPRNEVVSLDHQIRPESAAEVAEVGAGARRSASPSIPGSSA